jgi:glycine cleavage system H protein
MPIEPQLTTYYKRARFTTRLPLSYRYDQSHYWLVEESAGIWKIGLTRFATRMLGDLVDYRLTCQPGDTVAVGQTIGSIEGFKAISDIYCVAAGTLIDRNVDLDKDPSLLDRDPYDRGWLYRLQGQPSERITDVTGYMAILDALIDRILAQSEQQRGQSC